MMQILHEDNHLIAINKPAGWLVQGDETGDPTLADYVKKYIKDRYNKPGKVFLGTIHRIDRPVSGVVVFARTSKALERMNRLFSERKIEKTYWTITTMRPDPEVGTLINWLKKDARINKARVVPGKSKRSPDAKKAELSYSLLAQIGMLPLLKVVPKTGRPHQIRVQLAAIGCPIRGDVKYGAPNPNDDGSICLHARSLQFIHPVTKEPVTITAPMPTDSVWREFSHLYE